MNTHDGWPRVQLDHVESILHEATGILDDMVDHYERNDDPKDWPGWVIAAYDFLVSRGRRCRR